MKKQYIIPDMTIFKMGATVLKAASEFEKGDPTQTVSDGNDILSRGFWDFDDDEEE